MAKLNLAKLFKQFGEGTERLLTAVQSVRHYPGLLGVGDFQTSDNFSSVASKVSKLMQKYIMLDLSDRNPDMLLQLATFLENKIRDAEGVKECR
jgi:hypothetical protein